jgi:hypothetical protein
MRCSAILQKADSDVYVQFTEHIELIREKGWVFIFNPDHNLVHVFLYMLKKYSSALVL